VLALRASAPSPGGLELSAKRDHEQLDEPSLQAPVLPAFVGHQFRVRQIISDVGPGTRAQRLTGLSHKRWAGEASGHGRGGEKGSTRGRLSPSARSRSPGCLQYLPPRGPRVTQSVPSSEQVRSAPLGRAIRGRTGKLVRLSRLVDQPEERLEGDFITPEDRLLVLTRLARGHTGPGPRAESLLTPA